MVDSFGVDVEVRDHADRVAGPDEHVVPFAVCPEVFEPIRRHLGEEHVGLDGVVVDVDAVNAGEAAGESPGVGVVRFEPIDMMVEGVDPRRRDDPDLAHPAADDLAPAPRFRDEITRADEKSAGWGSQPLGETDRDAAEERCDLGGLHPRAPP